MFIKLYNNYRQSERKKSNRTNRYIELSSKSNCRTFHKTRNREQFSPTLFSELFSDNLGGMPKRKGFFAKKLWLLARELCRGGLSTVTHLSKLAKHRETQHSHCELSRLPTREPGNELPILIVQIIVITCKINPISCLSV